MVEASKRILIDTAREWAKFTADKEKFTAIAHDIAELARKCVQESIAFLKTQNIEAEADSLESLSILHAAVHIEPVIEETFPTVKASVMMKCGGASRAIVINPNSMISAGGNPFAYELLKKAIPPAFETNAADFVRDAFLNVARTGGKEQAL
jgi:hypothetical protein